MDEQQNEVVNEEVKKEIEAPEPKELLKAPSPCFKFLPLAIVLAAAALAGAYIYIGKNNGSAGSACVSQALTIDEAKDKALKYINGVVLAGQTTAAIKEISEEKCLFKIKITVNGGDFDTYLTRDGSLFFSQGEEVAEPKKVTLGEFTVNNETVCLENGKPVVYFFGSTTCPHCVWEKPIVESLAESFKDYVIFKIGIDSQENMDIFSKYSDGSIPALILGCNYSRVGSGEAVGEETETKNLTAIICKLTNGQPGNVCDSVKDLTAQVD